MIPTLIATPRKVFNARVVASLVTVTGNALSKRPTVILNVLIKVLGDEKDEESVAALDGALHALFASIEDPEMLNTSMPRLLGWYAHSVLVARSFLSCDAQDKKQCTDTPSERLRSIFRLLRGIRPRFVFVPRGLGEKTDVSLFDALAAEVRLVQSSRSYPRTASSPWSFLFAGLSKGRGPQDGRFLCSACPRV